MIFADINSPGTVHNLLQNPSIEINVVDPLIRKGYRFKGTAEVLSTGPVYDQIISFYKESGVESTMKNIVLVKVERALPLISPVYDAEISEKEVKEKWISYWDSMKE